MDRSKELIEKFARAAWLAYIGAAYPAGRRKMGPVWDTISKTPEGERWRNSVKSVVLTAVLEPDGFDSLKTFTS